MKLNLCTLRRKHRSAPPQGIGTSLREYKYEELHKATKGFSEDLGRSGCFRLHRGMLPDSTLVVVKIVPDTERCNLNARIAQYTVSGRHINVLPLAGFYIGSDVVMLVYEYMPRISLDLHLFQQPMEEDFNNSRHQSVLDWNRRYQIALGIARGLTYVHFSRQTHANIMPENILLDSDFCPKLTDYHSLLWCFPMFNKHYCSLSWSTRKTRSYIAPEVLRFQGAGRSLDLQSDVYSYGMLLFEMMSGTRNSENGETPMSFPTRIAKIIRAGGDDILSILDKRLARNADKDEVLRVAKLACWCIHDYPQQRPSMEIVVDVMEGLIDHDFITSSFADVHKCNDWSASELTEAPILVISRLEALSIPQTLFLNNSTTVSLIITFCPGPTSLPASIGALTSVVSLSIRFCSSLQSLPREMACLTSLETLDIVQCPALISWPGEIMQGLKSLCSLSIESCLSLVSLPQTLGNLTALEHLSIGDCPNLVYLPDVMMKEFPALQILSIASCRSLESLPCGLEHASSLHKIEIHNCPKLKKLPDCIGNISSLQSLTISHCHDIKFLPDGLQRIKQLQHLSIISCHHLELRCQRGRGEDWPKISHILFIRVHTSQRRPLIFPWRGFNYLLNPE